MATPTALIAARDRGTRATIRAACDPHHIQIVAEACGRSQAGELLRTLEPDVAIVHVGVLSTREFFLTGWGPVSRATRIVAVGPDDPHLARLLLAHGAASYVPLDRLADELPACLGVQGASRNGGYSSVTSAKA